MEVAIFSHGWGSIVWSEGLLKYAAPVVLAAEFAIGDGAQ